ASGRGHAAHPRCSGDVAPVFGSISKRMPHFLLGLWRVPRLLQQERITPLRTSPAGEGIGAWWPGGVCRPPGLVGVRFFRRPAGAPTALSGCPRPLLRRAARDGGSLCEGWPGGRRCRLAAGGGRRSLLTRRL